MPTSQDRTELGRSVPNRKRLRGVFAACLGVIAAQSIVSTAVAASSTPWGLDRINQRNQPLDNFGCFEGDGAGVNLYVVGTGIRHTNYDFGDRATPFYDFDPANGGVDQDGRGTWLASIAGGANFGVAWAVQLHSVRVTDTLPWAPADLVAGLDAIEQNGVQPAVVLIDGNVAGDAMVDSAIADLVNLGFVVVVGAGEDDADACNFSPARVPDAITVAASDVTDTRWSQSNFGTCVDMFAPGVDVTAAWLGTQSSTAAAAAHVAGAAATILQANPGIPPAGVTSFLVGNATVNVISNPGSSSPNLLLYLETGPCPQPVPACAVVPGDCCAGRPQFDDPAYTFTGKIAVGTASLAAGAVVTVYDFSDLDSAPLDADWPIARYSDPTWNGSNLGSVFGIAMDSDGNIYLTATTCHTVAAVASGGAGGVYRIDGVTGAVSVLASLPNSGPGLGNIAYDCKNDQLFVTNHEDGKIYRLDMTGAILSTFDHGAPDDGVDGFAPLGERLWGITVHDDRVWYGVWHEDRARPSASAANEVWSMPLDAFGDFDHCGTARLEITVPPGTGGPLPGGEAHAYSSPISDLRFTPSGSMLAAERSMEGDTTVWAHNARVLEFVCDSGTWALSTSTFAIGELSPTNSAGGVDIDYDDNGRVWASGDAIHYPSPLGDFIYGFQGLPAAGGSIQDSILVDYQGNTTVGDKTEIGDIVVSCPATLEVPAECVEVEAGEVQCVVDPATGPTGDYDVTITVTNNSGIEARYILLPGDVTDPDFIALPTALPGDGSSATVRVSLTGVTPLTEACFMLVLADANVDECCAGEQVCVTVPECDCLQATNAQLDCDPVTGVVTLEFDLTNLTADDVEHVYVLPPLAPAVGSDIEIPDSYFDIPTLLPYQTTHIGPVLLENAAPNLDVELRVTMHVETFEECCSEVLPITTPMCASQATLPDTGCEGDLDDDGLVGFSDLTRVLNAWESGSAGDVDGDGATGFSDLTTLLSMWGPCAS